MPKYIVYAKVIGTKYIGEIEADTVEDAVEKAYNHENAWCSVCHQCANEVGDTNICIDKECCELIAEETTDA